MEMITVSNQSSLLLFTWIMSIQLIDYPTHNLIKFF